VIGERRQPENGCRALKRLKVKVGKTRKWPDTKKALPWHRNGTALFSAGRNKKGEPVSY